MTIEFDPTKSARNEQERGLPFELVAELEWERALAFVDERRDYGETRVVALVPMQERLYAVCYVMRGQARRIISFRRASKREERIHGQSTADL